MSLRRGRSASLHYATEVKSAPVIAGSEGVDARHTTHIPPFFVLHERVAQNSTKKYRSVKRTIDIVQLELRNGDSPDVDSALGSSDHQRMGAFKLVWSKIESTIKDVLRNMNTPVFIEIQLWVQQSFDEIRSFGVPPLLPVAARSLSFFTDIGCKQLFTGLILTENLEFADVSETFEELSIHLKVNDCHVAKLSPSDFSIKNGIGGCLRTLSKQLLKVTLDVVKLSTLASWYAEQGIDCMPLVVIIDDMHQCCAAVLSEFILLLSEWVTRFPVILIMGSSTLDPSRNMLSTFARSRMRCGKFILGSPTQRMDAVFKSITLNPWCSFSSCDGIAVFLRKHFLRQDGMLISFIRALKIACLQHFLTEPLNFIVKWINFNDKNETAANDADLLSCASMSRTHKTKNEISQNCLNSILLALYGDARKANRVDLLEFRKFLSCDCCSKTENDMLPSMPDALILHMLGQEYGESINLHEWYKSFKSIVENGTEGKPKKKRIKITETQGQSEASLQARFCMAVKELQITGLLGMPNKRRPDFVQKLALDINYLPKS